MKTGKVVFPKSPQKLTPKSSIQFVFDGLPKVVIPEYKYEEKH